MPRLTLALVVLLTASPAAHAVPITAHAVGQITEANFAPNTLPGGVQPTRFNVGEAFNFSIVYDFADPAPKNTVTIAATVSSREFLRMFSTSTSPGTTSSGSDAGGTLRIDFSDRVGTGVRTLELVLPPLGQVGSIFYGREVGDGGESFRGTLTRVADATEFPAPEPSTLALGGIGGLLALGYRWRRRRAG